ncbi:GNAT family N-acetyltransferase [Streptomyces roseoverticillatus]|uniref:GNAT family N-acetyltransferase n=1 Tax=Streptomyces roseoverticillatus TaxID=66429 RepID=A0ABV3ISB6_9ACTN
MSATAVRETVDTASRPMTTGDIPDVIGLLRAAPQTAYCEWEDDRLLGQHLAHAADICRVMRDATGRVVAAVIAGSFGVRGTISHAVVAPDHRRSHLARKLVADTLSAFRERGVRRVFLFVHDDNEAAVRLWSASGFSPTAGESTLERDV